MKETETSHLEFGRVLEGKGSDRKVWVLIIPVVAGLAALLVFAGLAIAKADGLESRVKVAEQQAQEAQKAIEQRDELLKKARADEGLLRSPGQGVSVMAAARPGSSATGAAVVHPEQSAVKLFLFGLEGPEAGQEYRVEAVGAGGERAALGRVAPDSRGTAFLLAKNLPEGATRVEVVLAKAGAESKEDAAGADAAAEPDAQSPAAPVDPDSTLVLAGDFPKPGTAGVVAAPDLSQESQARTPSARSRRPLR
jgi:hypothetical protein